MRSTYPERFRSRTLPWFFSTFRSRRQQSVTSLPRSWGVRTQRSLRFLRETTEAGRGSVSSARRRRSMPTTSRRAIWPDCAGTSLRTPPFHSAPATGRSNSSRHQGKVESVSRWRGRCATWRETGSRSIRWPSSSGRPSSTRLTSKPRSEERGSPRTSRGTRSVRTLPAARFSLSSPARSSDSRLAALRSTSPSVRFPSSIRPERRRMTPRPGSAPRTRPSDLRARCRRTRTRSGFSSSNCLLHS